MQLGSLTTGKSAKVDVSIFGMVFHRDNEHLFSQYDLDSGLRSSEAEVFEKVNRIQRDQFLATPEDDLVDHIVASSTTECLEIYEDRIYAEHGETQVDVSGDPDRAWFRDEFDRGPLLVPGTNVTVSIPYTGDPNLWRNRSNPWQSTVPFGNIERPSRDGIGHLRIAINLPTDSDPERFKRLLDDQLKGIRFYLDAQKKQIETYNVKIPNIVREAIHARRKRLEAEAGIVAALGIPVKPREGAPDFAPIHLEKKKIVKPLPPAPQSGFKPEPGIEQAVYEDILGIIRHAGRTFEQTPGTYASLGEEALRDIVRANLNTHYPGDATAETFRRSGKTDLCLEDGERAAFVAECKIWSGPKGVGAAVDQLLGYLTWRDCKTAIIFFNKKVSGFTDLLEKVPTEISSHPNFKKNSKPNGDGEWRFIFRSAEDESREIVIHVFLFNLYFEE